jgi:putative nucleotidyltransferase with HDIG domain
MKSSLRLSTRTFLISFVPLSAALACGFIATRMVVKSRVRSGLRESLHQNESRLQKIRADYDQRTRRLMTILTENAGLKAAVGLVRESSPRSEIRHTIEDQLRELSEILDYDLLLVSDQETRSIAGIVRSGEKIAVLDPDVVWVDSALADVEGVTYELIKVPINLGLENLGNLVVGRRLEINSLNSSGQAILLYRGKVARSSFPPPMASELEPQLTTACSDFVGECEIVLSGEHFLLLPLRNDHLRGDYWLLGAQSIDEAADRILQDVGHVFTWIGALGGGAVLLLSVLGCRSVAKPITDLTNHLRDCEQTGQLSPDFSIYSGTREVDQLAKALNRAADAMLESRQNLNQAYLQFIETMAQALDARDPYTAGHSQRVSDYSTAIAQAIGLPEGEAEVIRIGALLHDIGKIGVADAVLQKPDRLTEEEFKLIKLHPQIGKRILERVGRFQDYLPIVELHHENHDGSGYPYGLTGHEVPLGARIVHVSDAYDAMTSSRAYRRAMPQERVVEILRRCSVAQFDPDIVEVFLSLLPGQIGVNEETYPHIHDCPSVAAS